MLDDRKTIIIQEIRFWKKHKLLPENYCDYLLALYTKGESTAKESKVINRRSGGLVILLVQFSLLVLMIPFSFLVIYFTQFHVLLQLTILILFIMYAAWLLYDLYGKRNKWYQIPLLVFLILILLGTNFLSKLMILNVYVSGVIMVINFIAWYLIGKKFHLKYLIYSSILALFITLSYIIYNFSHVIL